MARSHKLLVAIQGKGVSVVDLEQKSVVSNLNDCIVVAASPGDGATMIAGTSKGIYKSSDGGGTWQL